MRVFDLGQPLLDCSAGTDLLAGLKAKASLIQVSLQQPRLAQGGQTLGMHWRRAMRREYLAGFFQNGDGLFGVLIEQQGQSQPDGETERPCQGVQLSLGAGGALLVGWSVMPAPESAIAAQLAARDYDKAVAIARESLAFGEETAPGRPGTAWSRALLGHALVLSGDAAAGKPLLEAATAALSRELGPEHSRSRSAQAWLLDAG